MATLDDLPRSRRIKATILLASAQLSLTEIRKRVLGKDARPAADLERTRKHLEDVGKAIRQASRCL